MSSYFNLKTPTRNELNSMAVASLSKRFSKNKNFSTRSANIMKGPGSTKNKKNSLLNLLRLQQTNHKTATPSFRGGRRSHRRLARLRTRKLRK